MRHLSLLLLHLLLSFTLTASSDAESRSIKNSLDHVLREVKSKLELFFTKKEDKSDLRSRVIKTPMETVLPEAWLDDGTDFPLAKLPPDIEIHMEDIKRRDWQDDNWIRDIEKAVHVNPRKTRFRKKQKLKTRYENQEDEDKTESKIYFTQIIRGRPSVDLVNKKKRAPTESLNDSQKRMNSSEQQNDNDLLDKYSPFIYAELLKENETSDSGLEELETLTKQDGESVVINKVDVFNTEPFETSENIDYEEEEEVDNDMVTLEVAMVDTISYKSNSSDTISNVFLPFIPPSGINFEYEIDDSSEEESDNQTDLSEEMTTYITNMDPFRVSLKSSSWSFPVLVVSASLLCLVVCYEFSVIFSLLPTLSTTSHSLVLGLSLSIFTSLILTTEPTPVLCAVTRLLTPLSYTLIFSSLLVKFSFLTFLSSELFLSTSYQARYQIMSLYSKSRRS